MNSHLCKATRAANLALFVLAPVLTIQAAPPAEPGKPAHANGRGPRSDWVRRESQFRLPGGGQIQAIHEPPGKPVLTLERARPVRPAIHQKRVRPEEAPVSLDSAEMPAEVSAYVIHSPPINGFVPWVAVQATDRHLTSDYWNSEPVTTVEGNYLAPNPESSYGIGLLDTGAGVSVVGYGVADQIGLYSSTWITGLSIPIGGVTGTVDAWVSQPFGLWMAGLGSIDPDTLTLNTADLVGEYNVSAAMGMAIEPDEPDLFTAIGTPMSVFFASWIRNDIQHTIHRDGTTYEAPDVTFHTLDSPDLPAYPYYVPLDLRPTGAYDVWFWPCFAALEYCPGGDGSPKIPSVILGATAQSLFFAGSVNLGDSAYTAPGKTKFMVDTGAQVSVISGMVAAQLALNPATPDFTVEIQGVDGTTTEVPGFYVDTLDIPALGQWLSYTNVPVVMLDIASPEGGVLDGILGMNLFLRYNLVFRGGGLPEQPQPRLEFEPLPSINADFDDDTDVDMDDFAYLQRCLSGEDVPQTDPACQNARLDGDADVDQDDILLFINCASGPNIPAAPECRGM